MIYSNLTLHQRIKTHLPSNGKLSIVKLQQKRSARVEQAIHSLQIMARLLPIVVAIGKETSFNNKSSFLWLVHHPKPQHLLVVPIILMVMLKSVSPMPKEYQVISFSIKNLMYVYTERCVVRNSFLCISRMIAIMSHHVSKVARVSQVKIILVIQIRNHKIVRIIKVQIWQQWKQILKKVFPKQLVVYHRWLVVLCRVFRYEKSN